MDDVWKYWRNLSLHIPDIMNIKSGKSHLLDADTASNEYHILHIIYVDSCGWPDEASANSNVQLFA